MPDLWNGLTTEMTEEQIVEKAKISLNAEPELGEADISVGPLYDGWYTLSGDSNFLLPEEMVNFGFSSPLRIYNQEYGTNVWLGIFHKRLFEVDIDFSADRKVLLNLGIKRYGGNYRIIEQYHSKGFYGPIATYEWKTPDKLIFLRERMIKIIDRQKYERILPSLCKDESAINTVKRSGREDLHMAGMSFLEIGEKWQYV